MRAAEQWLTRRGAILPGYVRDSFTEQRAFMLDEAKEVAACCGRRAGKSEGMAGRLLLAAEKHPGEMSLYTAQTKNNARMLVGRPLMRLSRQHGLGLVMKEVDGRLNVIHPNGHHIWLAGARHRQAFEDFRGYKFAEVQVDEAQLHAAYLQEAIDEVLAPCIGDLDGAIVAAGTPSPIPVGYFHSITTGADVNEYGSQIPQWSFHHWTMAENIYFRGGKGGEYREQIRIKRGWHEEHPRYLREYMGTWVYDPESLVYPYKSERNALDWHDVSKQPPSDPPMVKHLGIDLGYNDSTAFVLVGHVPGSPNVYVLESWKRAGLIPSAIAAHIDIWRRQHRLASIVVDSGGLGKGYVEEFKQRYAIPCEPAEKQHKLAFIELLRGDFESGTILLDPYKCRELLDELAVLQWNEDRSGVDERFEDHCTDALLYAWRACRASYRPVEEGPAPGTPEYINAQMAEAKADRAREIARARRTGKAGHRAF